MFQLHLYFDSAKINMQPTEINLDSTIDAFMTCINDIRKAAI